MHRICLFCGSSTGTNPAYTLTAQVIGKELARRKIDLVFGGGAIGLMGVVANAVLSGGGHAIGVIPKALAARDIAHQGLSDLRIVNSMHERKALMSSLADAFIALPGGVGTFEEFCEALTWTQLGLHNKRCGLLNVEGYYDPLLALFDRAVKDDFITVDYRAMVIAHADPLLLLDKLLQPEGTPIKP